MASSTQMRDALNRAGAAAADAYPNGGGLAAVAAGAGAVMGLNPVAVGGLVLLGSLIERAIKALFTRHRAQPETPSAAAAPAAVVPEAASSSKNAAVMEDMVVAIRAWEAGQEPGTLHCEAYQTPGGAWLPVGDPAPTLAQARAEGWPRVRTLGGRVYDTVRGAWVVD